MKRVIGVAGFAGMVVAALCATVCAAEDIQSDATKPERTPRIAVIDLTRVYRSYAKADDLQKRAEEMGKSFSVKEQGLVARIRQLSDEAGALSMGSPRRKGLRDELAGKQGELANLRDEADRQLDETLRTGTLEVYEDTVKAVTDYAKTHAIDIVLKQQTFDPSQPSAHEQSIRIGQGNVLYCAPEFDITSAIIDKLNADYKAKTEANPKPKT